MKNRIIKVDYLGLLNIYGETIYSKIGRVTLTSIERLRSRSILPIREKQVMDCFLMCSGNFVEFLKLDSINTNNCVVLDLYVLETKDAIITNDIIWMKEILNDLNDVKTLIKNGEFNLFDRIKIKKRKLKNNKELYFYAIEGKLSFRATSFLIHSNKIVNTLIMAINSSKAVQKYEIINCVELLYNRYNLSISDITKFYAIVFPQVKIIDKINEITDIKVKRELKAELLQNKLCK